MVVAEQLVNILSTQMQGKEFWSMDRCVVVQQLGVDSTDIKLFITTDNDKEEINKETEKAGEPKNLNAVYQIIQRLSFK